MLLYFEFICSILHFVLNGVLYTVYFESDHNQCFEVFMENSQAQRAYEGMKQGILSRELKPGCPIIETEFAERFKMSRTPIREAIRRLYAEGLVDIFPRKGAYIKTFTKRDLLMSFEAAEAIEGMVAYLVAKNMLEKKSDKKWLQELDGIMDQMDKSLKANDIQSWASGDEKFHNTLYRMCDNEYIIQSLERIRMQLNYALWFLTPFYIDKKPSNAEHREIIVAIRNGDPEKARIISQKHRNRVRNELERSAPEYIF